jgi:aryl-alcohol dehydrogenase-like predicted oxidoreductase
MRGLAGGKLSGKYERIQDEALRGKVAGFGQFLNADNGPADLASLALGYLLAAPEVSSVIVGTRRLEAVQCNIASVEKPLAADLVARVREHAKTLNAATW